VGGAYHGVPGVSGGAPRKRDQRLVGVHSVPGWQGCAVKYIESYPPTPGGIRHLPSLSPPPLSWTSKTCGRCTSGVPGVHQWRTSVLVQGDRACVAAQSLTGHWDPDAHPVFLRGFPAGQASGEAQERSEGRVHALWQTLK